VRSLSCQSTPSREQCFHAARPERRRLLLDVTLVPERESEETPQLTAPVLGTGGVLVEQAGITAPFWTSAAIVALLVVLAWRPFSHVDDVEPTGSGLPGR